MCLHVRGPLSSFYYLERFLYTRPYCDIDLQQTKLQLRHLYQQSAMRMNREQNLKTMHIWDWDISAAIIKNNFHLKYFLQRMTFLCMIIPFNLYHALQISLLIYPINMHFILHKSFDCIAFLEISYFFRACNSIFCRCFISSGRLNINSYW